MAKKRQIIKDKVINLGRTIIKPPLITSEKSKTEEVKKTDSKKNK
jgi:hypothetical protein